MSESAAKPSITVVVPVYNRERTVASAVESALAQNVADIEVICIDDASSDGSRRILEGLAARDPRVRVIELPVNLGTGAARKTGILAAKGEYTLCLDADDRFLPNVFGRLLAKARRRHLDVLHFRSVVVPLGGFSQRAAKRFQRRLDSQLATRRAGDWRLLRDQARSESLWFLAVWNKLYRTATLQAAARLFSDNRLVAGEDSYLMVILLSRLPSWGSTNVHGVEYRFGEGSVSKSMTLELFNAKLNRADSCRALLRYAEEASDREIPGFAGPDKEDVWNAAPKACRRRVTWLNYLCSRLEVFMMEVTWKNIPPEAPSNELAVYHRKFFDAFGATLCQKFFSQGISSCHVRETITFRLGTLLLWPARTTGILYRTIRRRFR